MSLHVCVRLHCSPVQSCRFEKGPPQLILTPTPTSTDDTPAVGDTRRLEDYLGERGQNRVGALRRTSKIKKARAYPVLEELAHEGWRQLPPCLQLTKELKREFSLRRKAEADGSKRVVHRFQVGSPPTQGA